MHTSGGIHWDMTNTVSKLYAPHEVTDQSLLSSLIESYEADKYVTPVVVLADERGVLAVCGSHRIAAIKEVYNEDADLEILTDAHYLIVLDFAEVYESADEATQALLDRIHAPSGDDLTDLCAALSRQCGGDVAAALKDQIS